MIKARQAKEIILGLSDENLERLKKDQPIKFNLSELGFGDIDVFIFNGKDNQKMMEMLKGAIDPFSTIIKDVNAEKNN